MIADSKSQLAKLLATENLIVEHKKVSTASFDMKNRKLTIPILADGLTSDIYDLFVGHEVGHALNTPAAGWHDSIIDLKIPKSIINVVEDARIEKLIKRKYPGLRASFSKAYRELIGRNFFDTQGVDLNAMNILDRINMHFKGGASQGIKFDTEEQLIVDEIELLETFDDVIVVSKKIMELHQKQKEEQKKSKAEQSDQEDGDESEEDSSDGNRTFDDDLEDEDEDESDSNEDSEESSGDEDKEAETAERDSNMDNASDDDIQSHTDDAFRDRERELMDESSNDYLYGNIPQNIDLSKIIVPYTYIIKRFKSEPYYGQYLDKEAFNNFRAKSNKVVSYLVKEFEMRKNADQMKRASVSKTGELNMSKIYSYKFNDDLFKRLTVVPGGKSHGLVMFLDWSGSMVTHLNQTIKQLLNLVLFCKKVNIPFEVYAFTNQFSPERTDGNAFDFNSSVQYNDGDIKLKQFHLLNFFSSKMKVSDLNYIASMLLHCTEIVGSRHYGRIRGLPEWLHLQYTPLNESIICAMKIVPKFQKDNKLQVVNTVFLTDGEGHHLTNLHDGDRFVNNFYSHNKHTAVIRDPKTGYTAKIKDAEAESWTSAALSVFKNVTQSNVVGFYLLDVREFRVRADRLFPRTANMDNIRNMFKKDKAVVCTAVGYDEYYMIRADTDVDEDSNFETSSTTTRGLITAFTKYNTSKVVNRVVLNKFIGMIT